MDGSITSPGKLNYKSNYLNVTVVSVLQNFIVALDRGSVAYDYEMGMGTQVRVLRDAFVRDRLLRYFV
jgi:hypothetical protein